jgi:hypothetical protein
MTRIAASVRVVYTTIIPFPSGKEDRIKKVTGASSPAG